MDIWNSSCSVFLWRKRLNEVHTMRISKSSISESRLLMANLTLTFQVINYFRTSRDQGIKVIGMNIGHVIIWDRGSVPIFWGWGIFYDRSHWSRRHKNVMLSSGTGGVFQSSGAEESFVTRVNEVNDTRPELLIEPLRFIQALGYIEALGWCPELHAAGISW